MIRREIKQRFPNLPEETVSGWVEAYRDTSLDELRNLLNERQLLKDLFPVSSFAEESTEVSAKDQDDVSSTPKTD